MDDWREVLGSALIEAEQALIAATGDQSLCMISRPGGAMAVAVPAAKMAEGGWAALRALRDSATEADLLHGIDDGMTSARSQLQMDRGPAWQAYASGALTELTRLKDRLDSAST
jgi:hypothetical protein